jgi:hypothetical protein
VPGSQRNTGHKVPQALAVVRLGSQLGMSEPARDCSKVFMHGLDHR